MTRKKATVEIVDQIPAVISEQMTGSEQEAPTEMEAQQGRESADDSTSEANSESENLDDGIEEVEYDPTQEAEYIKRVKARKTTDYEHITTATGVVMVRPGFFIVEDAGGDKQAVREDIFLQTYETA